MKISLIGLGLIGSSIARALCRTHDITAYARSETTRQRALELGIVGSCHDTIKKAVKNSDIIIICTPLTTYKSIMSELEECIKPTAFVTDVGSVKKIAVDLGNEYIGKTRFIGGHPIAGTENSGIDAGFSGLFLNKKVILTPEILSENVSKLKTLWEEMGATVQYLDSQKHDEIYAFVSHLAQFLCWACMEVEAPFSSEDKYLRQFHRIGASDHKMWKDIFHYNKQPLMDSINAFLCVLEQIKNADEESLIEIFSKGHNFRKKSIESNPFDMNSVPLKKDYLLPLIISFAYSKAVSDMESKNNIDMANYTCTGFADMTLFALCNVQESVDLVLNSDTSYIIDALKNRCLSFPAP